jgi:hypothetical protein
VPIDNSKEEDFLDQIGETVTNIADDLFFNALDDNDNYDDEEEEDGKKGNTSTSNRTKKIGKKRYWRDRLEERLDYALGIHQDGKLYNKWQDRMEREVATEPSNYDDDDDDGDDPLSIMTGRSPRQHLGYRSKKKGNKAFWEQDGNLFAILFGNSNAREKKLSFTKVSRIQPIHQAMEPPTTMMQGRLYAMTCFVCMYFSTVMLTTTGYCWTLNLSVHVYFICFVYVMYIWVIL